MRPSQLRKMKRQERIEREARRWFAVLDNTKISMEDLMAFWAWRRRRPENDRAYWAVSEAMIAERKLEGGQSQARA